MRKNTDLDDTKPIEIVSDDMIVGEGVPTTREEKYKDVALEDTKEAENILEDEKELVEISEEEKEEVEKAEEALAEKNINEAEAILSKEKKEKEKKEKEDKKEKKTLADKWKALPTSRKVLIIICIVLFLLLIALLIFFAVNKGKKVEEPKKEKKKEEVVINIVDNYYYKDGILHIVDSNDKELGTYKCKNKDEKLCYVAINKYRDTLDVPQVSDENSEAKIERMPVYNDEYIFVYDNASETDGAVTLYSFKQDKEIETYLDAKAYDNNFIILKTKEGKYGFFQFKDLLNTVITPTYSDLDMIDGEDYLVGQTSKGYLVITKIGKAVTDTIVSNDTVKYYNRNFIVTASGDKYTLFNKENKILAENYRFITVKDDYAFLVDDSNKMYIIDTEGAKYNIEGISLKNTDYVPTYVYNADGRIAKNKLSFKISIEKQSIEIMPYNKRYEEDKNVSINLFEGQVSKTLNRYGYFNGVIYFYKDDEKKDLLGSYKCNNANTITANNLALTNCLLTNDTVFEDNDAMAVGEENRHSVIPLLNDRYVFITDGAKNIILYDLLDKKSLATYSQVNTYTPNNDYVFGTYNGDLVVVAVNKKNKYGVIKITGTEVQAVHPFDYEKIEKLGDSFIAKNANQKWVVLGNSDNEYADKVMGVSGNFVKTKKTAYSVIRIDNNKKIGIGYKYVELYDNYFAAVDNSNKLMIYDYDGDTFIKESVLLPTSVYTRTDTPAFKVTSSVEGSKRVFNISVFDGTKYNDNKVYEKEEVVIELDPEQPEEPEKPEKPENPEEPEKPEAEEKPEEENKE